MEKKQILLLPFGNETSESGLIDPFRRVVYKVLNDDGTCSYYNDNELTIPAEDVAMTKPMGGEMNSAGGPVSPKMCANTGLQKNNPFYYARQLLEIVPVIVFNEGIYTFSDGCYHEMSPSDMSWLIMSVFGESIMQSGSLSLVDSIIRALRLLQSRRTERDYVPDLIPFVNGLLDVTTMQLLPSNPGLFITYCVQVPYEPLAQYCPLFEDFLHKVTGGEILLRARLLEIIGYLISQRNDAKKFFVFVGYGDSGKSVMIRLIESLISEDSLFSASMNDFGKQYTIGYMTNAHLSTFGDMKKTSISSGAIGIIKCITGGDAIYGERKYQAPGRVRSTTKLLFSTNHELVTDYVDRQFMNRCCIMPFMIQIPPEEQDREFTGKLLNERAAIVNLAINAYREMLCRCEGKAIEFSGEALAAQLYKKYADSQQNSISEETIYGDFARKCCVLEDSARTQTERLYLAYTQYCFELGVNPDSLQTFASKFRNTLPFLKSDKWRENGETPKNGYIGIALKS